MTDNQVMSAHYRSLRSALIVTAFATKTSREREHAEQEHHEGHQGAGDEARFEGRESQSATTLATPGKCCARAGS